MASRYFNDQTTEVNDADVDITYTLVWHSTVTGTANAEQLLTLTILASHIALSGTAESLSAGIDDQSTMNLEAMAFGAARVGTINGQSTVKIGAVSGLLQFTEWIDGQSVVKGNAGSVRFEQKIDGQSSVSIAQTSPTGSVVLNGKVDGASTLIINCSGTRVFFRDKIDGASQIIITNDRRDGQALTVTGPQLSGDSVVRLQGNIRYHFNEINWGGRVEGGIETLTAKSVLANMANAEPSPDAPELMKHNQSRYVVGKVDLVSVE